MTAAGAGFLVRCPLFRVLMIRYRALEGAYEPYWHASAPELGPPNSAVIWGRATAFGGHGRL